MVYLGLDPSIRFTGFAVIDDGEGICDLGVIKAEMGGRKSDQSRLLQLQSQVSELCGTWTPDIVVIEDWQFRGTDARKRNKDSLKKLIWAIGACLMGVPEGLAVEMLKPQEWKGKKKKLDTALECRRIFGLTEDLNNNASDALMMTHVFMEKANPPQMVMGGL